MAWLLEDTDTSPRYSYLFAALTGQLAMVRYFLFGWSLADWLHRAACL